MNFIPLVILAFGMSMDAFAVAIAKGTVVSNRRFTKALKMGLVFGVVEGITPVIGWLIAKLASSSEWIARLDHWIAFVLLTFLGLRFVYEGMKSDGTDNIDGNLNNKTSSPVLLILTAVATSIDSMIVGVSLAFIVVNIWLAALLIGIATTIMATIGLYLGNRLAMFGRSAMIVGGAMLILIASLILYSHTLGGHI
ncbi:manganese efflux pump MntP family protein [Moraxella nasovis]|uniref:manganese efflux pump MntP n=1 Tax=Moraxella nasovis TaxID=2904121 RepID=UPI001F60E407|nr:manganese efflux pump MntP family protein [Moraxella nasovis]UNU73408.1 manganese efflux pump MntP family protein [Moraxella nasovis]